MPKETPLPDHKRVIKVKEKRSVVRETDKKPRTEIYDVEAKVFYSHNEDGTINYFYYRDNTKVPVVWNDDAGMFLLPKPKKVKKVAKNKEWKED